MDFRFDVEESSTVFNSHLRVDTDGDGRGDGAYLTSAATTFTASIAGTGASLSLRLTLNFDSGGEAVNVDSFSIFRQLESIPVVGTVPTTTVKATTQTQLPVTEGSSLRVLFVDTFDTAVRG